jgi:hypothetical protein
MELPHHPEDDTETSAKAPMTGRAKVIIAVIVVLVALVVVLHLTGVIGE